MASEEVDPSEEREPPVVEQLRNAIRSSGQSLNQLSKVCRVDPSRLSRFLRGERSITLDAAGRICEALGIALDVPASQVETPPDPPPAPKRRGKK